MRVVPIEIRPDSHALRPPSQSAHFDHRFDVLGSGLARFAHGVKSSGFDGCSFPAGPAVEADLAGAWLKDRVTEANAIESRRIWSLIGPGYIPIDWHLDAKSGFRWNERTWYRRINVENMTCADVKVPWEVARMQHLPGLAIAATLGSTDRTELDPQACVREFRNEVLDFIATNPPRFGIHWMTAMEVAIRVANWLLAYDLFVAAGTRFDPEFDDVFTRSVLEHGRHIAANLEWSLRRGNHYLADLVGLVFVAAHLPHVPETDRWLAIASCELVTEIERQFLDDGGNFESSACYHRLSTELVVFGVAVLMGLDEARRPALPASIAERLRAMADLVIGITKQDGRVPQVGDNDSGRLFKIIPVTRSDAAGRRTEDHLDFRHVVAEVHAVAPDSTYGEVVKEHQLEMEIVGALARRRTLGPMRTTGPVVYPAPRDVAALDELERWIKTRPRSQQRLIDIPLPRGAGADLDLKAFPNFGLYVARSPRLFVAIRCGTPAADAPTGHIHNDQLSIELSVDGEDWIRDPGTYVYTPFPDRRNAYRSAAAHFGPRPTDREPARLDSGLFSVPDPPLAWCLNWGEDGFAGRAEIGRGRTLVAIVRWQESLLSLLWGSEGCELAGPADSADWRAWLPRVPFSPGYGIQEP